MDGKALAAEVRQALEPRIARVRAALGRPPGLAVVLIGDDPASAVYVRNKERSAQKLGMASQVARLPASASREEALRAIQSLNEDPAIDGIIVQWPFPPQLDELEIFGAVAPEKDVDGFNPATMGRLLAGRPRYVPCTPLGIMTLLRRFEVPLQGAEATVIGRSNIVGKPMALELLRAHATVTWCHSRTRDLAVHARRADVLVVAAGKAGLVTGGMVKPGACVIDVGINQTDQGLVGDVEFESASRVAGWITPVPGGVGPMTVAMLMQNTVLAAERRAGLEPPEAR